MHRPSKHILGGPRKLQSDLPDIRRGQRPTHPNPTGQLTHRPNNQETNKRPNLNHNVMSQLPNGKLRHATLRCSSDACYTPAKPGRVTSQTSNRAAHQDLAQVPSTRRLSQYAGPQYAGPSSLPFFFFSFFELS